MPFSAGFGFPLAGCFGIHFRSHFGGWGFCRFRRLRVPFDRLLRDSFPIPFRRLGFLPISAAPGFPLSSCFGIHLRSHFGWRGFCRFRRLRVSLCPAASGFISDPILAGGFFAVFGGVWFPFGRLLRDTSPIPFWQAGFLPFSAAPGFPLSSCFGIHFRSHFGRRVFCRFRRLGVSLCPAASGFISDPILAGGVFAIFGSSGFPLSAVLPVFCLNWVSKSGFWRFF